MSLVIGKNHVSRLAPKSVATPDATDSFVPVSHFDLATLVADSLIAAGFEIVEEDHVIARGGLRYFGGFAITRKDLAGSDRQIFCGVRNSCDKGFAAAICIGNRMLVCENMCFSSEKALSRRHTKNIKLELPSVVSRIISELVSEWSSMSQRIELYKNHNISEEESCLYVKHLVAQEAIPKQKMFDVLELWDNPALDAVNIVTKDLFVTQHNENGAFVDTFDEEGYKAALAAKEDELMVAFAQGENLWRLYNQITASLKGSDIFKLPKRTIQVQAMFDTLVGFNQVKGQALQDVGNGDEAAFKDDFGGHSDNSAPEQLEFNLSID